MNDGSFAAKLIIVGNAGVGKTLIIRRYVDGDTLTLTSPTINTELDVKVVYLSSGNVKLNIWDTVCLF